MRKITGVLVLAAFLFLTFSGCASKKSYSEKATASVAPTAQEAGVGSGGSGYYSGASNTIPQGSIKKVIKNGEIAIEVKDVDAAYSSVMKIVAEVGGEEFNKNYTISNGYKRMTLVLKIPAERLDEFQQKLENTVGSGSIKRSSIRSEDITSEYYDVAARLESYEASRDQLRELLKKAATVDEILKIHSELTRIQADIDSMRGQINMWDKLVSMATITLYIDEESDPLKRTATVGWKFSSAEDVWRTMKNGFVTVVNTMYNVLVWTLIIIVSISPLLAVAGVVVFIILYIHRKRKKGTVNKPPLA